MRFSCYQYRGRDRRGVARGGRTQVEPAVAVERWYRGGWRDLTVLRLSDGVEVGGITKDPNSGRRVWWFETVQEGARNE